MGPLLALGLLWCGCSAVVSDSNIKSKLPGAWIMPQSKFQTGITYYPDGIWVSKSTPARRRSDYSFIEDGVWEVKDGFIIKTTSQMTQARYRDSDYWVERIKVIRVDDESLLLRWSGETNLVLFERL